MGMWKNEGIKKRRVGFKEYKVDRSFVDMFMAGRTQKQHPKQLDASLVPTRASQRQAATACSGSARLVASGQVGEAGSCLFRLLGHRVWIRTKAHLLVYRLQVLRRSPCRRLARDSVKPGLAASAKSSFSALEGREGKRAPGTSALSCPSFASSLQSLPSLLFSDGVPPLPEVVSTCATVPMAGAASASAAITCLSQAVGDGASGMTRRWVLSSSKADGGSG